MTSALNKLSDGTLELTITVPWSEISKQYEDVVASIVSKSEVPGFRKGKAPRKLVEEKVDKNQAYEEVLKELIPKIYSQAVSEQKIRPIVTPKIELTEASEGKDWIIRALTCEKPAVVLGDYKKTVGEMKAAKHKKIWVPGKEPQESDKEKETKPTLDEILKAVLDSVTVTIPSLLTEHEVNRLLSDLIDQTKKLGLTVEQYLASTNRTADGIRHEYEQQSKRTLTLEFALEDIADKEGIFVSDDDIATVIKTAKSDDERKTLENQRYYVASILRRQKTIDYLASL